MCYTRLNDQEETYSSCPYCSAMYTSENEDIDTNNVDIYLINCLNPICDGFVEYSDNACLKCRVEFTEEDWDFYLQSASHEEIEAIRNFYEQQDPDMICCYKSWADCSCDKPVEWDDTDKIPVHIWEKVYDGSFSNDCNICKYQYTESCLSLGNFVVNFVRDGVIGTPITICSDFSEDIYVDDNLQNPSLMAVNYGEI